RSSRQRSSRINTTKTPEYRKSERKPWPEEARVPKRVRSIDPQHPKRPFLNRCSFDHSEIIRAYNPSLKKAFRRSYHLRRSLTLSNSCSEASALLSVAVAPRCFAASSSAPPRKPDTASTLKPGRCAR